MGGARYVPIDEPDPGQLANLATSPIWPFLGLMLCGGWLGWPWFAANAYATGSSTRQKELALAAVGAVGGGLLLSALAAAAGDQASSHTIAYVKVALNTWQLGIGYVLFTWQARTFSLFETYGGEPKSGLWAIIVGFIVQGQVLGAVNGSLFFIGMAS